LNATVGVAVATVSPVTIEGTGVDVIGCPATIEVGAGTVAGLEVTATVVTVGVGGVESAVVGVAATAAHFTRFFFPC
jgi:hypothetical protein